MRIQCDACAGTAATVVCCADEAAAERYDVEIHATNRLACKHQGLPLGGGDGTAGDLPHCDVCQEKPPFIFCEDRALFCRDCDEPIHVAGMLSGNQQRYLATGIRVGFSSVCGAGAGADGLLPPKGSSKPVAAKTPPVKAAKVPVLALPTTAGGDAVVFLTWEDVRVMVAGDTQGAPAMEILVQGRGRESDK